MRRHTVYIITTLIVFCIFIYGCGSSNSINPAYSIPDGNHALLGPLSGADVTICELAYSDNHSCVSVKTDNFGTFKFSNTYNWDNNQIVLVTVTGGKDIDSNDDGLLDATPTSNKGTIHGFAKVSDLVQGKTNITILSEIVYNYVSHLCSDIACNTSYSDLEKILGVISDKLAETSTTDSIAIPNNSYFGIVTKYNPLKHHETPLKIGKSSLETLSRLCLNGDNISLRSTIDSSYSSLGLAMSNPLLSTLKNDFKLSIVQPSHAELVATKDGITMNEISTIWLNKSTSPNSKYQFKVQKINQNYQLVKWMGCSNVSSDGLTCTIDNINDDIIVSPIILPKLKLSDNVSIIDITGLQIEFNNLDSNIYLTDIEPSSPLLENITITTDNQSVTNLKPGDIVTHKIDPVFFRKVSSVSVTNSDITNTKMKKVRLTTVFEPITKIIPRGYLSTIVTPETAKIVNPIQLISSQVVFGKSIIPYDPSKQVIIIDLKKGTIRASDVNFSWQTTYNDNFNEELDKNTEITGDLIVRPHVDLNIGWDVDVGWSGFDFDLDGVFFTIGSDIRVNGSFNSSLKKKYSYHKILYDGLQYHQVYLVYGIPIKVTLKIPITAGIKGAGAGPDFDKAMIVGNVSIGYTITSSPTFYFTYNGKSVDSRLNTGFNFSQSGQMNLGANAFAYIGAEPGLYVYGIGVKMDNYIGPYLKLDLKASQSTEGTGTLSLNDIISQDSEINANLSINGKVGIGYYGRIFSATEWDNDIAKKVVDKINDAIRGKYTEFWKEWPIYTVNKEYDTTQNSLGINHIPGELEVLGERFISIDSVCGDTFSKKYTYILKNIGDDDVSWQVYNDYTGSDVNFTFSKSEGTIPPRSEETLTITVSSDGIPCSGLRTYYQRVNANLDFKQKIPASLQNSINKQTLSKTALLGIAPLTVYTDWSMVDAITKFTIKAKAYATRPISWIPNMDATAFSNSYNNIPINNLKISWNKPSDMNMVDGYSIFYSENSCTDQSSIFANTTDSETNNYIEYLQRLQQGKTYCFKIYAYKDLGLFNYRLYFPPSDTATGEKLLTIQ